MTSYEEIWQLLRTLKFLQKLPPTEFNYDPKFVHSNQLSMDYFKGTTKFAHLILWHFIAGPPCSRLVLSFRSVLPE